MNGTWQALITNLAVVALFASVWAQLSTWLDRRRWLERKLITAALVSVAAIATIAMAVEVAPGIYFDLRAAIIAVGAFFSGPVVAVLSVAVSGAFRILQGGAGTIPGLIQLATAAGVGLGVRALSGEAAPARVWVVVLAAGVFAVVIATATLLFPQLPRQSLMEIMPPQAALSFGATLLIGFSIRHARAAARERLILRSALAQAPEFLYVKDTNSRFLTVNEAVARHHGRSDTSELVGMSDFELVAPDLAQRHYDVEQTIMRTGAPMLDVEEAIVERDGKTHWYRSSKVPLRDPDGQILGLTGVTVETTHLKQLERENSESRDRLSLALGEMSDGLAVFDKDGRLMFCNEQYRATFPLTADVRVPGVNIMDILRKVADVGEQLDIPEDDVEGWVQRVGSLLRVPNVVTIALSDGRYIQMRNKPASDETAVVIATDVTDLKIAENALIEANADLSRLASTDELTGLANRRVFDEVLARDMARTGRSGSVLSLVMIDIDRFKHYNDTYGHPAGDRCLELVAHAIRIALQRPTDLAARYGGEEFAVILPDTDATGATIVAERIRSTVSKLNLDGAVNVKMQITASLGVAIYDLGKSPETPQSLIANADKALYAAKHAGRDRVVVHHDADDLEWSDRPERPD